MGRLDRQTPRWTTPRARRQSGFSMLEVVTALAIIGVTSAIAMPTVGNAIASFRLTGDIRSVSNAIALTKMRAASNFSRVRLYVDLAAKSHHLEVLDRSTTPAHWTTVGGSTSLATQTSLSYGVVTSPPPSTQASIGQAPLCTDDAGATIASTACVAFNSRGVPVDSAGASTALDALYLTDGTAVYAVTVSATGMTRVWRTQPTATPSWTRQ